MPIPALVGTGANLVGGLLSKFGKKKRSACWVIASGNPNDVPIWVSEAIEQDIATAWGERVENVRMVLNRDTIHRIHIQYFVPMCREIEGDNLTEDGHRSGKGKQINEAARARFRADIAAGKIASLAHGEGQAAGVGFQRTGGDLPVSDKAPSATGVPAGAGSSAPGALLLGGGVLAAVLLMKGRKG